MAKDNVIFLEVIEWFDETGKDSFTGYRRKGQGDQVRRGAADRALHDPALSVRYCTCPAFAFLTACTTSCATVPTLGLGISPRGPRIGPAGRPRASHQGWQSRHRNPSCRLDLIGKIVKADNIGSRILRLLRLVALRKHRDAHDFPVPCGSTIDPRTA